MNILITGATGFLGKQLLIQLLQTNYIIGVVVRDSNKINNYLKQQTVTTAITIIDTKHADWKQQIRTFQPHTVIHLAAVLTSVDDEPAIQSLIHSNIEFGCHLLDALKQTSLKYFINTGTFAEYKLNTKETVPAYLYAATKTAFRSILSYYQSVIGFKTVNVIPYTVYGASDTQKKLIDYICESVEVESKSPIQMSPGEQVLDFIHINDVVDFYKELLTKLNTIKESYLELSLGTAIGTTPKQIASLVEAITQKQTHIEWGGRNYRQGDTMYAVANLQSTANFLNWTPKITVYQGLKMYIEQIKKQKQ